MTHTLQVERLIAAGATLIQIRDKSPDLREWLDDAAAAVKIAKRANVRILINDRADAALITGADGVHLGQTDILPVDARTVLGERAIIGYSTHTEEQFLHSLTMPVDYVAFGPIFDTKTKSDPDKTTGIEALTALCGKTKMPVVAIGGIDSGNISDVLRSGAASAAIISAILKNGALESNFRLINEKLTNIVKNS